MAIKTYKRTEKRQLSKNFTLDELKCKCGKCGSVLVDETLVARLQQIRDHFGKAVTVNSGYRCEKHNASPQVGGAKGSRHVKGMAADIRVSGITPQEVAKYAESIGVLGIGLYDTFVHIDTRTAKSFWKGHAETPVSTFGGKPVTVKLPVVQLGCRGDSVMALQAMLQGYGYDCGDQKGFGSFDKATQSALKEYQLDCELAADGICGSKTWGSLLGGL